MDTTVPKRSLNWFRGQPLNNDLKISSLFKKKYQEVWLVHLRSIEEAFKHFKYIFILEFMTYIDRVW